MKRYSIDGIPVVWDYGDRYGRGEYAAYLPERLRRRQVGNATVGQWVDLIEETVHVIQGARALWSALTGKKKEQESSSSEQGMGLSEEDIERIVRALANELGIEK